MGKCQRNGVNHPETSSSTLAVQSDLISVEGWAVTDVVGLAPGAFLKAGRSFWNNNSNTDSNLSEWIFFTSNALNSNFIQDESQSNYRHYRIAPPPFFFFFAMYNFIWHRRAWAYVPHWDKNLGFSGKQESITGEWWLQTPFSGGKGHSNFSTFFI